ncbi:hypothetical protein HMI54_006359 [Coelomomyces lativittatus]|nr:hypothetical protein HMI56_006981 [Coelomomyces lativittatus]KAJ1517262.1 hypothetical protein HMI54_006359 [Coelomomyces lativittatus]KAJ1517993.1 hypothetical protein HMI55_004151 [Coelomomyces lativittatus]
MSNSVFTSAQSSFVNEQQETWTSVSRLNAYVSVKLNIPDLKTWRLLRHSTTDTLWNFKCSVFKRVPDLLSRFDDCWNWGFLYNRAGDDPSSISSESALLRIAENCPHHLNIFLEDNKTFEQQHIQGEVTLTFCRRYRITHLDVKKIGKINDKNSRKKFLGYLASQNNEKLRGMLQKGFDPNITTEDNLTPLIHALRMEDNSIISLLLHFGAFPDYRTLDQKTPLHWVAQNDKAFSISTLIKWGANPNIVDLQDATPLHYACSKGYTECVEQLLRGLASPHTPDGSGRFPLHLASLGHVDCISLLLEAGANIHVVNRLGNTPLHVAASMNEVECALLLLKNGANRDALNLAGKTAEQMAISGSFFKTAEKIKLFEPTSEPEREAELASVHQQGAESLLAKSIALRPILQENSIYTETGSQSVSRKKCPAPPPPSKKSFDSRSAPGVEEYLEKLVAPTSKSPFQTFHDSKLLPMSFSYERSIPPPVITKEPAPSIPLRILDSPLPPPPEFDFSTLTPSTSLPTYVFASASSTPSMPEMNPKQTNNNIPDNFIETLLNLNIDQIKLSHTIAKKITDLEEVVKKLTHELEQFRRQKSSLPA